MSLEKLCPEDHYVLIDDSNKDQMPDGGEGYICYNCVTYGSDGGKTASWRIYNINDLKNKKQEE